MSQHGDGTSSSSTALDTSHLELPAGSLTGLIGPDGVETVRRSDEPDLQSSGGGRLGNAASGGEDPRFPEVGH